MEERVCMFTFSRMLLRRVIFAHALFCSLPPTTTNIIVSCSFDVIIFIFFVIEFLVLNAAIES